MKEQQRSDEEPIPAVGQQRSAVAEPYDCNKLSKGAFSKINRELTEEDLKSPGTQRLILNELDIERYNDQVFSIFKKYNSNTYKASYVDCSSVVSVNQFNLDYVVSLDKFFEKFEEISLLELN